MTYPSMTGGTLDVSPEGPSLPRRGTIDPSAHPVTVFLSRLAPGSRRTMLGALATIARLVGGDLAEPSRFPWHELRRAHVQAVRSKLSEVYAPASANKMLSALRGVLTEAWRGGLMPGEDYHRAVDVDAVKGSTAPTGRELGDGEIRALFEACAADSTPAGARDAALLAVLFGAGLRRSEASALDIDDYEASENKLTVRAGKGRKARVTYLPRGACDALAQWIVVLDGVNGPMFSAINKGGRIRIGGMTDQAVRLALMKRAKEAGVSAFTPHDLRRTFVSRLLDAGADLSAVKGLAGHSDVSTTARYDRRGERAKKSASGLLHVPFIPRAVEAR